MNWMKTLTPILQAVLKAYLSPQTLLEKPSQKAKDVAVQSGIIGFGTLTFFIFLLAALVMTFVDLGNQIESNLGVHFSGMMISSLFFVLLGLVVFGTCYGFARYLAAKERKIQAEVPEVPPVPKNPLHVFGEELMKQLIVNLKQE